MKFTLYIITFLCCIVLTACNDNHEGNYVEVDGDNKDISSRKPSLDAKIKVQGDKAIIYVDTSMKISKKMFGKEKKQGEGHIHMYLDNGEKQPITASPVQLEGLTKGDHHLKLSLHNNDHTPYDVTKTITFTVN